MNLSIVCCQQEDEEISYTDVSKKGHLTGAAVCRGKRGNDTTIALGRYVMIIRVGLTDMQAAASLLYEKRGRP